MSNKRDSSEINHTIEDQVEPEAKTPKLVPLDNEDGLATLQAYEKSYTVMSFPEHLMYIMDNQNESGGSIVWKDKGTTFWISVAKFSDKVLPRRFPGTKFESFVRKLNRWGFKRIHDRSLPSGIFAYHHNLFKKGRPELLKRMSGVKKKDPELMKQCMLPEQAIALSRPQDTKQTQSLSSIAGLLHPKVSLSCTLSSHSLEQVLLKKQILEMLSHSVSSPVPSLLNTRQDISTLIPLIQSNDTCDLVKALLLQQQIAQLSAVQVRQLTHAATSTATPALFLLRQLSHGTL